MNEQPPIGWLGSLLQQQADQHAPARVRTAMAFLHELSVKTSSVVAGNSMSIEEFKGQDLTDLEKTAQGAACDVLIDYFNGKLKPDIWEQRTEELRSRRHGKDGGTVIRCVSCGGSDDRHSCRLCRGTAELIVYPLYGG